MSTADVRLPSHHIKSSLSTLSLTHQGLLQCPTHRGRLHSQGELHHFSRNEDMLVFYLNLKSHTHSPADSQPLPADKTGPSNASTAIIIIGDIFGGGSQVLQVCHLFSLLNPSSAHQLTLVPPRALTFLPTAATPPTSMLSIIPTFCAASMPTMNGSPRVHPRTNQPEKDQTPIS